MAALGSTVHLGYVGPIEVRRGVLVLLSAIVGRPDVRLTMAGSGADVPRVVEHAADLGLGERVRLVGALDRPALEALYRSLDLLVVPSLPMAGPVVATGATVAGASPGAGTGATVAGTGAGPGTGPGGAGAGAGPGVAGAGPGASMVARAVTDALAAGVPVVASDEALAPVIGTAGVVVRGGDAVALRQAIIRLADDPAERRRLAGVAAGTAEERP